MKKLLFAGILIVTFTNYGLTQGLTKAISNMQSKTSEKVKQMLMQTDSERNSGAKTTSKNYAAFTPSASENLKNIASEMGKTAEEKAMFLQLFTETKKGFEAQAGAKKNNVAAAMMFLMATAVMVYHESPEPSDKANEKLFNGLNSMFDEMPEMASASSKDKQFLYDLYISYGGLILASYEEAKGTKNRETIDGVRVIAGSTLLDVFKINPTAIYFEGDSLRLRSESGAKNEMKQNQPSQATSLSHTFAKQTTNFDDGWVARPTTEYVQLQRNGTEVRLFYVNQDWDTYPNTVQHEAQYWSKAVTPYFNVSNVQKWSGVEYPVIYFVQADAVDKQTGKRYFVAMKVVFDGGGKAIVAITPNQSTYQQQFPHPNDLNKMLNYNKFGVSPQDLIGSWSGGGGGAAEYYNVYTGGYAGMSAVSTANDFVFNSNGNYQHIYRSANLNTGSNQFAKLQYNGKFSVSDWEINATNHYKGTTAKFASQIVAVKGGYLLILTDTRNDIKYTLFRKQ